MTLDFDIVDDALVGVLITHDRTIPPVFALFDAGRVRTEKIVPATRSDATTFARPIPLARGDIVHPQFPTRRNVLLMPQFVFFEHTGD